MLAIDRLEFSSYGKNVCTGSNFQTVSQESLIFPNKAYWSACMGLEAVQFALGRNNYFFKGFPILQFAQSIDR
jgi:hypothetical protein